MDPLPTARLLQGGPRVGTLPPSDESGFQAFMAFDPNVRQWRNAFQQQYGEPPNMADPSFDYRQAYMAGNRPQAVPGDTVPHWDSRGKAPDHATTWMNDFMGQYGVDPNVAANSGLTPEQSGTINNQLYQEMLVRALKGGTP